MSKSQLTICVLALLIKLSICGFLVDSPHFKPQSAMAIAFKECNENYSNVYFDLMTRKWSVYKYPTCLSGKKDVLSFCQRIYPKLNIVNVYQLETVVKFNVHECINVRDRACMNTSPAIKYSKPYRCLHGDFKEAKLNIPPNCQIQHLFSQNECKSDEHWRILSNEKCKSLGYNLNSSNLLQWCDAFTGGISSFSGIEFVCCQSTNVYIPTKTTKRVMIDNNAVEEKSESTEDVYTAEEEDIDDENDEYQSEKILENNAAESLNSNEADSSERSSKEVNELNSASRPTTANKAKKGAPGSTVSYATLFFVIGFLCTILVAFAYYRVRKGSCCNGRKKDESILINNFNTEDTHMNAMQQNGYENPTYRFFEQSVKA